MSIPVPAPTATPGVMTRAYRRLLRKTGKFHPRALFHVDQVRDPVVALTIDDGPSERTGEILDLLHRHDSRATFFLHTDPLQNHVPGPSLIPQMLDSGHEVANHMPEDRFSIRLSPREFESEFVRAHQFFVDAGHRPRFFRAAGGFFHVDHMLPCLQRLDYYERFIMASYLPWDVYLPFPDFYSQHLAAGAFPGAILVLHDGEEQGSDRLDRTLETLSLLLPRLRARGFRIEPLGQVMAEAP